MERLSLSFLLLQSTDYPLISTPLVPGWVACACMRHSWYAQRRAWKRRKTLSVNRKSTIHQNSQKFRSEMSKKSNTANTKLQELKYHTKKLTEKLDKIKRHTTRITTHQKLSSIKYNQRKYYIHYVQNNQISFL